MEQVELKIDPVDEVVVFSGQAVQLSFPFNALKKPFMHGVHC